MKVKIRQYCWMQTGIGGVPAYPGIVNTAFSPKLISTTPSSHPMLLSISSP